MSVNDAQQYHLNVVHTLRKDFTFADDGTVLSMGWLPANSIVTGGGIMVKTAFDSGTSDVVDLGFRNAGDGTSDDTDEYATDLAATTAGVIVADALATAADAFSSEGAEAVVTYTSAGTAPTAGTATAYLTYIVLNT